MQLFAHLLRLVCSSLFPFMGIWAIRELHAAQGQLAFAFLGGALLAGGSGYPGGHLDLVAERHEAGYVARGRDTREPAAVGSPA